MWRRQNEPSTPPPPPPSTKKRPRSQRRPDPMPDPPPALVQLLQTNPTVLSYFTSLRSHLVADVQVWKDRAQYWKTQYDRVATSIDDKTTTTRTTKTPPSVTGALVPSKKHERARQKAKSVPFGPAAPSAMNDPNEAVVDKNAWQQHDEAEEVDDAMFDEALASSSDDDDVLHNNPTVLLDNHSSVDEQRTTLKGTHDNDDVQWVRQQLRHTINVMASLGMPLLEIVGEEDVDNESDDDSVLNAGSSERDKGEQSHGIAGQTEQDVVNHAASNTTGDGDQAEQHGRSDHVDGHQCRHRRRRSDAAVLEDLNACLKQWIKAVPDPMLLLLDDSRGEQCTRNLERAPNPEAALLHQFHTNMEQCMEALLTLDAFGVYDAADRTCPWLSDSHDNPELLREAFYNRTTMIDQLVRDLEYDISSGWIQDDCAASLERQKSQQRSVPKPAPDALEGADDAASPFLQDRRSRDRLTTLLERRCRARIYVHLLLHRREDDSAARAVLEYLETAALARVESGSSGAVEPPVLSFVVLDALQYVERERHQNQNTWIVQWCKAQPHANDAAMRVLDFSCWVAKTRWEQISQASSDDRRRKKAMVELRAFDHLSLFGNDRTEFTELTAAKDDLVSHWRLGRHLMTAALVQHVAHAHSQGIEDLVGNISRNAVAYPLAVITQALQRFAVSRMESLWRHVGQVTNHDASKVFVVCLHSLLEKQDGCDFGQLLHSCNHVADGLSRALFLSDMIRQKKSVLRDAHDVDHFICTSRIPLIRVINLDRRKDRLAAFTCQAMVRGVTVVKALPSLDPSKDQINRCFGDHAIDGSGRLRETQQRFVAHFGSAAAVDGLVATHWRPHDLKAFDRDAPDHDGLVRSSASERACALSHVQSWKGVLQSLELGSGDEGGIVGNNLTIVGFQYGATLARRFRISGFAAGPPLHAAHANMPPAPVCIVMEDDAILHDRFVEKLERLLQELPRDLHFCALGYSRPKTAPIMRISESLGMPTCQYYLTGYLLSEAGARYLLDKLPVVGPVDTWIGLQQLANWDNVVGTARGVGSRHRWYAPAPPRKDVRQLLQFRAYCSIPPLCWQRVQHGAHQSDLDGYVPVGRSWRSNRDTDIEYSGDAMRRR